MKNLPIPLLTFLAAQVGAEVWWGAQIDAKVKLVEENRSRCTLNFDCKVVDIS